MDTKTIDNFLLGYKSQETRRTYRWMIDRALEWCESNSVNLAEFDQVKFYAWVRSNPWNDNTTYSAYCALRAFTRWIFGDRSPLAEFTLSHPRPKLQRTLTVDQANRLLESINTSTDEGRRYLAIITLMLSTGLRSFEVAGALLADLDLQGRCIKVKVKGGGYRLAVFSFYTASCLTSWLGVRETWAKSMTLDPNLFVSNIGKRYDLRRLRKIFKLLGEMAGLPYGFSPHDLRRTFATLATRAGAPARIVMAGGGWTDFSSFMRYTMAVMPSDMEKYDPVEYSLGINR